MACNRGDMVRIFAFCRPLLGKGPRLDRLVRTCGKNSRSPFGLEQGELDGMASCAGGEQPLMVLAVGDFDLLDAVVSQADEEALGVGS